MMNTTINPALQFVATEMERHAAAVNLNTVLIIVLAVVLIKEIRRGQESINHFKESINHSLTWLLVTTPERLDFWHPRQKNTPAPYDRPKGLRVKLKKHYGDDKCAVTGIPTNSDTENKISFVRTRKEGGTTYFKMKLWEANVGGKLIYKGADADETIEKYAETEFGFDDDKTPYTHILTYHHKVCYYHAKSQGRVGDGKPDIFGSPLEDDRIPKEIHVSLDSFSDEQTSFKATPSPLCRKNKQYGLGLFPSGSSSTASMHSEQD
ncbi:expressed unknown protein [Seminavis robusta]|uniref:Uncharacterized protein n=1 Tax=Seminavis robusta TaxID=568900 RepID=A0A9N8EEH1_9STRA|nr:expressed unknown protein [Seminavis robusta]|eukprot:Sro973_g226680.1 n/a (265) ;mRNA; r:25306-26240